MPDPNTHRLLRAESLTAIGLFVAAAGLLFPTAQLQAISALLPATMLIAIMVFALIMLVTDQRRAAAGEPAKQVTQSPKRVLWAFLLILAYALAVDFVGFYVSTAVSIPLVAYVFGYRNPLGLAVATVIMLTMIYLIFGVAMSQEFPAGRLWPK